MFGPERRSACAAMAVEHRARQPGSVLFWRVGYAAASAAVRRSSTDRFHRPSSAVVSPSPRLGHRSTSDRETPSVGPRSASAQASRRRRPPYLLTYLPTEDSLGRTKTRSQLRTWSSGVGPKRTGGRVRSVFSAAHRREIHNCSALHCIAV